MEKYSPLDTNDPSESQPVLQNKFSIDSEHDPEEALPLNLNKKSWFVHQGCFALSFHLLLIIFYTFLAVSYSSWQAAKYSRGPQNIKSPARDIVEFEPRRMDNVAVYSPNGTINPYKSTQYNGYPRPELENAWSELTQHQNVRIKESELGEYAGDESLVKLSDGSGYWGTLSVFHGLHCVERVHKYIYKAHYYPGIEDKEVDDLRLRMHTEHCLDWLRQYVQCNADLSLISFHWGTNQPTPIVKDEGKHQCVRWEPVEQWMAERNFSPFEKGLLVHPIFGDPYKDHNGDNIGIVVEDKVLHGRGR